MEADWTEPSPEVDALLRSLNERSVPLIAIYPPGENSEPIKLRDIVSEDQVLSAIREANGKW